MFNEKAGMALRGTFLIDAEGTIAFAEVNQPGDAREQSGWKDAVGTARRLRSSARGATLGAPGA